MKEVVILSGKGGTGKTSLTAAFAALAQPNAILVDCDVDAADLHLVVKPNIEEQHPFISGKEASIRPDACIQCGRCETLCRFNAIENGQIDHTSCEGCGVCVAFCPQNAIDFTDRFCGYWMRSHSRFGPMLHARLEPAGENSGRLVSKIREEAHKLAKSNPVDWMLIDGPPGIGCPVIASVTGTTAVVAITEPTLSGQHDLQRLLRLTGHFKVPTFVCINKWDINPEMAKQIETDSPEQGAESLGRIPYDRAVTQSQIEGTTLYDQPPNAAADAIHQLWEHLCSRI
jgi:MinD superfamily P-loop ATPase